MERRRGIQERVRGHALGKNMNLCESRGQPRDLQEALLRERINEDALTKKGD